MFEQYGTVLIFKAGVSKDEAQAALEKLADILEPSMVHEGGMNFSESSTPKLHEFDPAFGGPVWYIP